MRMLISRGFLVIGVMMFWGCANALVTKTTVINRDANGAITNSVETEMVTMKQSLVARKYTPHYVDKPLEEKQADKPTKEKNIDKPILDKTSSKVDNSPINGRTR